MTDANPGAKVTGNNYASNSQKAKQPDAPPDERVLTSIISGEVHERKEPLRKKFLQAYAGDSAQSVGAYLLMDVIVPGTKNLISDLVKVGIDRLLYGGSRPGGAIRSSVGGGVAYGKFFNGGGTQGQAQQAPQLSAHARANHQFGEIVLQNRGDAELVIEELRALIEAYGNAKVTNLYSLVGISGAFTDQKYGWTNLTRAQAIQTREGWLLDLPRPEVLP